jgi:hypothetical protein
MSEHDTPETPASDQPAQIPVNPLNDVPEAEGSLDEQPVVTETPIADHPAAVKAESKDGEAVKDRPELYVGFDLPTGANPHVAECKPALFEMPKDTKDEYHISFIPINLDQYNSFVEAFPSINLNLGPSQQEWAEELDAGSNILNFSNFMNTGISRGGTVWGNRVPHGTSSLGIMRPAPRKEAAGTAVAGEMATLAVRQSLGLGVPSTIPLWHSGFWISIKAPSTSARVDLQQRLDAEKITLGRKGQGFTFANDSVYLKSYLMEFALAHVTSANVHYQNPQELRDLILSSDINTITWGVLTALYPHGYPFHQPCVNDPTRCNHVVKEMLDLYKIHFVDYQKLTEAQLQHMSQRLERMDKAKLENYRAQHYYVKEGTIELKSEHGTIFRAQLKVPTVAEYMLSGMTWIEGITADVQRAFGSDVTGEQRNRYIEDRGTATSMATYAHWVKEIGLDSGAIIVDPATIQQTLAEISHDIELRTAFLQAVQDYAEKCSITVEALPKFDCPACGRKPSEDELKHPYLAPINIESLFFTMQGQHIRKVLSR